MLLIKLIRAFSLFRFVISILFSNFNVPIFFAKPTLLNIKEKSSISSFSISLLNFDKSFLDLLRLKVEDDYNSDKHLLLEDIFFLLNVYSLNKNLPKVVNLNQQPVLNFLN